MATGGTRALDELRRAGIPHVARTYALPERHGPARDDRPHYGLEAAAALGLSPEQVCKTLVAEVDGQLVLAVLPSDASLDLKRLAAAVGARRADLADRVEAERATGLASIHVSAGRRGLQVSLAPADLIRLTGADTATISVQDIAKP